MIIGDTNFGIQPWPEIKTSPGLGPWQLKGNGYYTARDLGISQDRYESQVLISDTKEVIAALQAVLKANKKEITLSGFNSAEIIFGADVDYSEPITATYTAFGPKRNFKNDVLFDLEINFRAIEKTLLITTPSLAGLNLQEKWEGDKAFDITKLFGYDQSVTALEHSTDAGFFKGRFLQTTEQMKAIRAYLLTVARANAIPFPTMGVGDFYPFGDNEAKSLFQKCNVIDWRDRQVKLDLWELEMVLAQALPYFSGGDTDGEESSAFFFEPSDSEDLDFFMTPGDL